MFFISKIHVKPNYFVVAIGRGWLLYNSVNRVDFNFGVLFKTRNEKDMLIIPQSEDGGLNIVQTVRDELLDNYK